VAADAPASASVFFDFPETGGSILPARWCHAVASMGERLYVYGGLGLGERPLSDIHFFSVSEHPALFHQLPMVPCVACTLCDSSSRGQPTCCTKLTV